MRVLVLHVQFISVALYKRLCLIRSTTHNTRTSFPTDLVHT